jgi:uncharacterized protein YlaI
MNAPPKFPKTKPPVTKMKRRTITEIHTYCPECNKEIEMGTGGGFRHSFNFYECECGYRHRVEYK